MPNARRVFCQGLDLVGAMDGDGQGTGTRVDQAPQVAKLEADSSVGHSQVVEAEHVAEAESLRRPHGWMGGWNGGYRRSFYRS